MSFVLTNGNYYITHADTGAIKKTDNLEEAEQYTSINKAIIDMKKAPKKTNQYYVFDTETKKVCYKHNPSKSKARRKKYSVDARKLIYDKADGKCELCGRKIVFEDMTLDHVKPLSMNGEDNISNLQCSCLACNQFKGSILPDDFMERVTSIFLYQMEKKQGNKLPWKITKYILNKNYQLDRRIIE